MLAGLAAMPAWAGERIPVWLKSRIVPLRSIDPADEDFSDLNPVGDAIGGASMVLLGEPSHGAGSAFAAKARLVKFLHQHHGFDVLVWESGLYDVALAQAGMASAASDAVAAARKGVFALWTEAAEVAPLFDYIKASQATPRPLVMAGFDMQVTADGSVVHFAQDLRALAGDLRAGAVRNEAENLAETVIAARDRLYATKFAEPHDLESLAAAVKGLGDLIASNRAVFDAARNPRDIAFLGRCLANMRSDAQLRAEAAKGPTNTARESRRDAWNADNLRWLAETYYPGRKIIVWAHNVHVMNGYYAPGFRDLHLQKQDGDMITTGVLTRAWLGDKAYVIGITAFTGEEGFAMGGPHTPIAPAPPGSIEAGLHALGKPFVFVNLKAAPDKLLMRAPKFDANLVAEPGQVYDGLIFIDRMKAATHV